ncbi:MAG: hypothetical protein K0S82_1896 [Gaiellaceae bacterium]|nr:hypothetical protein [Gaiellaceae bacterium]
MRRRAGWRLFSCEPLEIGEPDLDERPHRVLEPGLARDGERLLVALAGLRGGDTLLEAVVARHEQLLDPRARILGPLHARSLAGNDPRFPSDEHATSRSCQVRLSRRATLLPSLRR